MNQVVPDPPAGKASRDSLTGRSPASKLGAMSAASRFTVSLVAAVGWTLSSARPVFA
jgi:hypothetical protein